MAKKVLIGKTMSSTQHAHQLQVAGISSYYSNSDVRRHFSQFGAVTAVMTVQRVVSRLVAFEEEQALTRALQHPQHSINQVPLTIRKVDYKIIEEEERQQEENKKRQEEEQQKEKERKEQEDLAELKRQQEHPLLVKKERRKNRQRERRIKRIEKAKAKAAAAGSLPT